MKRPPELNRLPKRLLQYIVDLEGRVYANEQVAAQTRPTKVYTVTYSGKDERLYLKDDARVCFEFDNGDSLEVRRKGLWHGEGEQVNGIEVTSSGRGLGAAILIRPGVSNVVWLSTSSREIDDELRGRGRKTPGKTGGKNKSPARTKKEGQ